GNLYTFKWTITGLPPCGDSQSSVNISTAGDIAANFTTDKIKGCGPTTVTFTNTSTPNTSGTFLWDFGDGSPTSGAVTPPPHTFVPGTDGKDVTYTVSLTPVSNCNFKTPFTMDITVSPAVPIATLVPSQTTACGAFTLTVRNTSPGNNVSYDFYLTDPLGNVLQHITKTDKSDAVFVPVNPKKPTDYQAYIIATDECGNQNTPKPITISASPSSVVSLTQIKGDPQAVCLGNSITLQNVSSGGDRFTYTLYDSNKTPITTIPAGTGDMNYTPTAVGTYYISIIAGNNGCGDAAESALKKFTVYADPTPDFNFSLDNDYNVTFTNITPANDNTPPESLVYLWDFGDGSAKQGGFTPKKHFYDYSKSPFTATLTVTNAASGCFGVVTHTIIVNFLGGLYLPNAFVPSSSNPELQVFKAKGNSIKEWHMQIFNNFGQLVWETTKLDADGSPVEGWDGTYKGAPAQQGVYIWQISATLINGDQWKGMSYNHSLPKRTGVINLIR
ncbi:MAG: gliding motility-associated C-terminal domain-containing protein, partial [Mucilaginibacter sp.]